MNFVSFALNMSAGKGELLDLKLNLGPPSWRESSCESESELSSSNSSSEMSVQGSCVSSEAEKENMQYESDTEPCRSMLLVGCPRCLMYVLLSEVDPKCPRCKSTVLLGFLNDETTNKKTNN